ncbi:MAG: hypothetical protein U9P12_02110, partial [Verrucomicrobiota bacterium]|nr:hypothetical protein [Verrucomicrobiota bacterium]
MKLNRIMIIVGILAAGMAAQAQTYTWDVVPGTVGPGNNAINTGNGTWDTSTGNWTTDEGTNNIAWVNGSDAYFSGGQTISLASGVSVGGIELQNGPVNLKSVTDNNTLTVVGSPTWELKTRTLQFINDKVNDTRLAMTSGETLTVTGTTAQLNTGEKPEGADWNVAGATLDFQATSGLLKGNKASVGQFDLVKMAGGSKFIHERNANETYGNNWELGTGTVTIDNRYSRNITLNGVVSGEGVLQAQNLGNGSLLLRGNNTFSGGLVVDSTDSLSVVNVNADTQLGAVPGAIDADNITLRNGGTLLLTGMTINANRGIALDGGGTVVLSTSPSTYAGKITGTGGLQIGHDLDNLGNTLVLSGNTSDYTGGTLIHQGSITLGADNALPTDTVLSIGGKNTAALKTEGFDLSIGGLATTGIGTRYIENNSVGASTITIDTAVGTSHLYRGNLQGSGDIHIVKTGAGTQEFDKSGYVTAPASLTVNGGTLVWNSIGGGATTVGLNGTLGGSGTIDGAVTVAGNLAPGNSPGTLTFNSALTLESTATTTLEITGTGAGAFDILANDGGDTLTADGILALDTTGYTATLNDSFLVFSTWVG